MSKIKQPGKESPQRAADDTRDNSRAQPSGRGKAAYGGFSQGGENPRAASAGQDGGKYSQPQLKGDAKTVQRRAEHNLTCSDAQRNPSAKQIPYIGTPAAGNIPPGRNHGGVSMDEMADRIHPTKRR